MSSYGAKVRSRRRPNNLSGITKADRHDERCSKSLNTPISGQLTQKKFNWCLVTPISTLVKLPNQGVLARCRTDPLR
jgi:hypothetical protein